MQRSEDGRDMKKFRSFNHSLCKTVVKPVESDLSRGLSSHPVGMENTPETNLLPPGEGSSTPPQGENLFWQPADTSTVC